MPVYASSIGGIYETNPAGSPVQANLLCSQYLPDIVQTPGVESHDSSGGVTRAAEFLSRLIQLQGRVRVMMAMKSLVRDIWHILLQILGVFSALRCISTNEDRRSHGAVPLLGSSLRRVGLLPSFDDCNQASEYHMGSRRYCHIFGQLMVVIPRAQSILPRGIPP